MDVKVCVTWLFLFFFSAAFCSSLYASSDQSGTTQPHLLYRERLSYADLLFSHIAKKSDEMLENDIYVEAGHLYKLAMQHASDDEIARALGELDHVIVILETITTQRPLLERDRQRYLSLKEGLPYFISAYERHLQQSGRADNAQFLAMSKIDLLVSKAETFAEHSRYGEASVMLREAQDMLAMAIKKMLDHTQIGVIKYERDSTVFGMSKEESQLKEYHSILKGIDLFLAARQRHGGEPVAYAEGEEQSGIVLIKWLRLEADGFIEEKRYSEALTIVTHIRDLLTRDLSKKLNGKDIVVKLDLSTPELEYKYEHNQYLGYDELIPVAMKQMRPSKEETRLITEHTSRGHWMAVQAEEQRKKGNFPVAIRMIQDAKKAIQDGLKAAGVPIYSSP